jgi:hypothetical protein
LHSPGLAIFFNTDLLHTGSTFDAHRHSVGAPLCLDLIEQ